MTRNSRINGVNPDVYRWNGRKYVQSNNQFSWYYNDKLAELTQSIHSPKAVPTSARVLWCEQAAKIYLLQRRLAEAFQLCEEVLGMIDDPNLTTPNSVISAGDTPAQRNRVLAQFEVEKLEGKADIHQLLGDIYKSMKNLQSADKEYAEAQTLRDVFGSS